MQITPHFATGFHTVMHEIDGVTVGAILRANARHDYATGNDHGELHHKTSTLVADLEAGAAMRAEGKAIGPMPAREVRPYGSEPGMWFGERLVGGESTMLIVRADDHAAAVDAFARMFGDLHAGEMLAHCHERTLARARRHAASVA